MARSDKAEPAAAAPASGDRLRIAGLLLLALALLCSGVVADLVFQAWHRAGYERSEALVVARAANNTTLLLRIGSGRDEIRVARSSLDAAEPGTRHPVWYNAAAELSIGIRLFDRRVVSAQRQPQLPGLAAALLAVLANLAAVGIAVAWMRGPRTGAQ